MAAMLRAHPDDSPRVILLGERTSPSEVYVAFSKRLIEMAGVAEALDLAYKTCWVFELEYNKRCYNAWEFMQEVVYGMNHGRPIGSVVQFTRMSFL